MSSSPAAATSPRAPRRLGALFLGLASAGLLLVSAEALCRRVWGPPDPALLDAYRYEYVDIHDPFFRRRGSPAGPVYRSSRPRAPQAAFPASKAPGVLRVFVLGGSVAMPFGEQPFLESVLERSLPGRRVEVVGCGMGAYDSYRERLLLDEVLARAPDLVILLSGNNEIYPADQERSALAHRLGYWARRSRLAGLLAGLDAAPRGFGDPESFQVRFDRNLRIMARAARARGVPMVLCTLPVNFRDAPLEDAPWSSALYRRAWALYEARSWAQAERAFRECAADEPGRAIVRFWLARTLERQGRWTEARDEYFRALDLYHPGSNSPRKWTAVRKVAAEEGTILADLEADLRRVAPHGLLGRDFFRDDTHWHREYYPLAALTIARAVHAHDRHAARPALAPGPSWDWSWLAAALPGFERPAIPAESLLRYARASALNAVKSILDSPPGTLSEPALALLDAADDRIRGELESWEASPDGVAEAYGANPWAAGLRDRLAGRWPAVLAHLGEMSRRKGDPVRSAGFFRAALRRDPGDRLAREGLGRLREATAPGRKRSPAS